MAALMAVAAPSLRKPGLGFAPWEMGSPARRPLGVAPSVAPMVSVFAQENRPGTIWKPCTGVRCALTSRVKIWERRTARPSASLPPLP